MGEIGYKGFKKGLVCKDKQYAENTVFEEPEARICRRGMHYCKNPFDVLDHYSLIADDGSMNEFATVEALAEEKTNDGKKFCTTKLKVGARLTLPGFVKACVDFIIEKTKIEESENDNDEDSAQMASSGNYAKMASSGNYAQMASSGDSAQMASSGNYAQMNSTGMYAVVMCAGHDSKAKAKKGSFITLAEWEYSEKVGKWIPINVKTRKVDGKKIKEDTYYKLENGKFVEAGD